MSVLQRRLSAVAGATEANVGRLWQRHLDGEMTEGRLVEIVAVLVAAGNQRAVTVADLVVASMLVRQRRTPLGLMAAPSDVDRLADATRTVLAADIATATSAEELAASRAARLGRMARSEPLAAGQDAVHRAFDGQGVSRWVRETDPDPCPLCSRWADGKARPVSVRMARHVGCACVPAPIT